MSKLIFSQIYPLKPHVLTPDNPILSVSSAQSSSLLQTGLFVPHMDQFIITETEVMIIWHFLSQSYEVLLQSSWYNSHFHPYCDGMVSPEASLKAIGEQSQEHTHSCVLSFHSKDWPLTLFSNFWPNYLSMPELLFWCHNYLAFLKSSNKKAGFY